MRDAQPHQPPLLARIAHQCVRMVSITLPSTATLRPGHWQQVSQIVPHSTATGIDFLTLETPEPVSPGPELPLGLSTLLDNVDQPDLGQQLTGLHTLERAWFWPGAPTSPAAVSAS